MFHGDAAPRNFKKWDTAPGLHLKHPTSLNNINVCYSNNGLNNKAICKTCFYTPAWSIICATQRRLLHTVIGPVSRSPRTILRWDLKLKCLMERRGLWHAHTYARTHPHTLTTPSTTLVMTSDWWWRWRWRVLEKDELGHRGSLFFCFIFSLAVSCVFISVALLACPCHAVSWQLLHVASCTVMLGQLSRDPDD